MTNRIVYFFSLLFVFLILGTVFVLMRFSLEKTELQTYQYISEKADYIIEIQPEFIFKSGILSPLLNGNLPHDDRAFFEPDEELILSESTGISFLSPFYLVIETQQRNITSIYFRINSYDDFTLFAKKLNNENINIVAHSNLEIGIISYSTKVSQNELLKEIESLLKQPSGTFNSSKEFSLNTAVKSNPINIYSCFEGKITHTLKFTRNEVLNSFNINGSINYSNPTITQKIAPDENGFYFALAFSDDLKYLLAPFLKNYLSESAYESISGIELNYFGVEVDRTSNKPTPNFNLHIHLKQSDSTVNLFSEINKSIVYQNSDSTLILAKNFLYNYTQNNKIVSIYNTHFNTEDTSHKLVYKVEGEPSTIVKIQEPFSTIAFSFEPRLHSLNRYLTGMKHISGEAKSTGNILEINQELTYQEGVNPVFEMLFFFRKMNVYNKDFTAN